MNEKRRENGIGLWNGNPVEYGQGVTAIEIRHYRFDRITLDPEKCFGKPCIRGLRMPIASILSYLSSGMTTDDLLREWPELEREDISQALGYAAWAMEERVVLIAQAG
jgi:uncharacterized protein (DUF433 family)